MLEFDVHHSFPPSGQHDRFGSSMSWEVGFGAEVESSEHHFKAMRPKNPIKNQSTPSIDPFPRLQLVILFFHHVKPPKAIFASFAHNSYFIQ
jgi:hypothetical protein